MLKDTGDKFELSKMPGMPAPYIVVEIGSDHVDLKYRFKQPVYRGRTNLVQFTLICGRQGNCHKPGKTHQGSSLAAFWWHFCSADEWRRGIVYEPR